MRKTMAQKVEELHAATPEQFKDFMRDIAAIPKADVLKADAAAKKKRAKRK
jgi:hypothetical protein